MKRVTSVDDNAQLLLEEFDELAEDFTQLYDSVNETKRLCQGLSRNQTSETELYKSIFDGDVNLKSGNVEAEMKPLNNVMGLSTADFFREILQMEKTSMVTTSKVKHLDFDSLPSTFEEVMNISRHALCAIVVTEARRPFRIHHVNESWSKMCEYSEEEAVGKSLKIIQGDQTNKERLKTLSAKALADEKFEVNLINYKKSGTTFLNHLRMKPLYGRQTSKRYLLGVLQEVKH